MKKYVYLAGPICGLSQTDATDWRHYARERLVTSAGIIGIDPLRVEPVTHPSGKYVNQYDDPLYTPNAIFNKNRLDVKSSDVILAHLPYSQTKDRLSIGTIGEMFWGFELQKPVVVISTDERITKHLLVIAGSGWIVETLDEGIDVCIDLLGDYV